MQLMIGSSLGVCDQMLSKYRPMPQVLNSLFQIFLWHIHYCTYTCMVDWFVEYKCGEALSFWIWLCKNYLHNQVFGSDFHESDEIDRRRYPSAAPTHCSGQWECEDKCIHGSNTFVNFACESSWLCAVHSTWLTGVSNIKTFSFNYQFPDCEHNSQHSSVWSRATVLSPVNDILGQMLFYGVLVIVVYCSFP